jgi:PKD repeat protein
MRSTPLMAVSTVLLAAAWACGGGGTDVGTPPVANFSQTCTGLSCTFADLSTPAGGITGWEWNFGDPTSATNTANVQNPTHTFTAAGTFTVSLKVTDGSGANNTKPSQVPVGGTANQNPTASFDLPATCTAGTPCGFHSTSTDLDGTILTEHWQFGDGGVVDGTDATHTYAAAGAVTVTLTVTDDKGGTGIFSKPLTVAPAASQDCTTSTSGTFKVVDCTLTMTQTVKVKFIMGQESCDFSGNDLRVTAPVSQGVFFNLCNRTVGEEKTLMDATGTAVLVFQPGSQLTIRFLQGHGDAGEGASDPGIQISGSSPNWTLNIDDGGNPGVGGEPDFNDAIVRVEASAP